MLFIYPPTPVSVSVPPLTVLVDGVSSQVNWDTTTPANTIPVPNLMHYMENGSLEVVNYDGVTKANTRAIPVKMVGVDGTAVNVNITTGDIGVQLRHNGTDPDSTQIGDGTTIWKMEAVTGYGLTKDVEAITELQSIVANTNPATNGQATEAKQDSNIIALGNILTELQLKADLTETQPVSIASLPNPTGGATEAKQDDTITAIGLLAKLTDTQPVSAVSLPLPTGATTEATLTALSAKLPATLGSKVDAGSLSVTQSAEDKAVQDAIKTAVESLATASTDTTESYYKRDFSSSPLTVASSWVNLRTLTAPIKRISVTNNSGNELLIRNQTANKSIIIGAGATVNTSLVGAIADVIEIQAITADAVDGIIYLNFEG